MHRIIYHKKRVNSVQLEVLEKHTDEILECDPVENKDGHLYISRLNLSKMTYEIVNVKTNRVVRKSKKPCTNKNYLYRAARKALVELGVDLKREIRKRTFGLCDKGYNQRKHIEKEQ